MLIGSVKGIGEMEKTDLEDTLIQLLNKVWPSLLLILVHRVTDTHLVLSVCLLIQKIVEKSGLAIVGKSGITFVNQLCSTLTECFLQNPKNLNCL
jgi:hypothetical protein